MIIIEKPVMNLNRNERFARFTVNHPHYAARYGNAINYLYRSKPSSNQLDLALHASFERTYLLTYHPN